MIVYICGAYRSRWGLPGVLWHIWKARQATIRLAEQGYVVFSSHLNWGLFDGHRDIRFWLDCGLKMLERCDAIYLMKGWTESNGSCAELERADELGLKIMWEE